MSRAKPFSRFLGAGTLVFAVALALRLIYLVGYRHNPFFADPQMDALYHDRWASQIARGDVVGSEVFFRAPLYPYFLGLVYAVSGHSYLFARIVQAVIGALSAVLVGRIARRLFGPVTGITAGLMAAALGTSVYYEAELLLVVLEIFLSLLAIDLLLALGESEGRPAALGKTFVAGLVLGLAAITRPNFLIVTPLLLFVLHARLHRFGRAVWGTALLLYLAGVATPVAVTTLRNFVVGDDFVPIASQGGLNFYLGNNARADGMAAVAPEFRSTWYGGVSDATRLAEEALGRPLKASEVSDYWFARGLDWVVSQPWRAIVLTFRKTAVFWQAFEVPNNEDFYFFNRWSFLFRSPLLLTFGAVAPLALAGLFHARRQRRFPGVIAGFVLLYSASIILFFVCGRFRAPVTPFLVVPAAFFLVDGASRFRQGQWRVLLPPLALLAVSAIVINADWMGLRKHHTFAESYLRIGIAAAARGKSADAEEAYRKAIDSDPRFAEGHNNLGVLLMQQNRSREALEEFEAALAIDPDYPRTLNNLAAWYEREGDLARARSFIDRALVKGGGEVEICYNAGIIYGRQGEFAKSAEHFRRLLQIEPGHLAGRLGLGKSLLMQSDVDGAMTALNQVLEREPRQVEALYYLGLARARKNDLPGAREAWEAVLKIRPDDEPAKRQLQTLDALPSSPERKS